jgi:acetoacetyl-CoA synthetase
MTRFIRFVNDKYGRDFHVYPELYEWSITNIGEFWEAMWEFGGIIASKGYDRVVDNPDQMPGAKWFPGARLNFAENLLRHDDDRPALIFRSETGWTRRLSFAELREEVARLAKSLKEMGVEPGDRVAGFMPNLIETVTAMLAAASLGAIWSSCSPDFGFSGIIDRFGQIEPKVLFTADGYFYNGKRFDSLERAGRVARGIPSIERLVVVPYTVEEVDLESVPKAVSLDDFRFPQRGLQPEFEQLPFDHPVYILYSSGTTGVPKCIVHGGGGTLIQHLKEHMLHADLKPSEQLFYFTTCGWMMWNWMVSCLAVGAAAVLFDGSPMYPDPGALWQLSEDESVNVFGTSARYLAALEKSGAKPGEEYDLTWLKAILSTASPLSAEQFKWVYANIKQDLCLSSISGGTDIVSCFAGGNPIGPVYAGQLQAPGLGMAVEAWDETGRPVWGEKGELVCTKPFPSMPVSFWNDPDGEKYRKAYFDKFPGVWAHGDFCEMTHEGGVIIHGRSDATLNPGGVRIGTAEIYRQVETMPEVNDCLVVGQQWQNDERVILFVKPAEGVTLDDDLVKRIKQNIRSDTSPRHVPAKILQVSDIPYTRSGKKVEMAVRKVIHGRPVQNREALANPQALELYAGLEELSR